MRNLTLILSLLLSFNVSAEKEILGVCDEGNNPHNSYPLFEGDADVEGDVLSGFKSKVRMRVDNSSQKVSLVYWEGRFRWSSVA